MLNSAYNNSFRIAINDHLKYDNKRFYSCSVNFETKITSIILYFFQVFDSKNINLADL